MKYEDEDEDIAICAQCVRESIEPPCKGTHVVDTGLDNEWRCDDHGLPISDEEQADHENEQARDDNA